MARQLHRLTRLDSEAAKQIEDSANTAVAPEFAHRAAQTLIGGFPGTETEDNPITRSGIVAAVATNGIDDIAELWADSPATTLPGTLWRLFLMCEWIRRNPELVARRYATLINLTETGDTTNARLESALDEARPAPPPTDLREYLDTVLAGGVEGSVTETAPLLSATAGSLRALATGSDPVWIEDDIDELADRVTRRDSALLATADELTDAVRRVSAGLLDWEGLAQGRSGREMSKSDAKARSECVKVDRNRMIPRFYRRREECADSFVSDLDTVGTIGETMRTSLDETWGSVQRGRGLRWQGRPSAVNPEGWA